ncbi:alpha/beta fold hydrolase [Sphingomonas glacialis]|uniref:Alpha/beta hydrolase n=1 Tax=Sphingomonas glacialis TaxID=658225 RepID=A0A502FRJ6_9SPHN|nr:alpha/beta hydrolase [Sphingomonas glacialis]TPG52054.1 alpha/beta hydrolase [Sphingomonas glacialis]
MTARAAYSEHLVSRDQGKLYVRDYAGAAPTFVLMHGFPDNLHIYDALVPFLTAAGRRVVTFDFLGFGQSEKPLGATYTFQDQLRDLAAVVDELGLGKFVPVAHDSSGPTAINYTLAHPDHVAELVILNSGYDDAFPVTWPEMVSLFANQSMAPLARAIAQSPAQFGWLLAWQKNRFSSAQPTDQRDRFNVGVGRVIADNFIEEPSSGPAFISLASEFYAELARNSKHLPELKTLEMPVKVIWGEYDPYVTTDVGRDRASHFRNASFSLLRAGHWLQADLPGLVAREMLA